MVKVALTGQRVAVAIVVMLAGCGGQPPQPSRPSAALVSAGPAPASSVPATNPAATRFARDYPVGDLVGADPSTAHSLPDFARYVRENVDPGGWADDGGDDGTMDADVSRFVLHVVQTPDNQRKITALLAGLRTPGTGSPATRP